MKDDILMWTADIKDEYIIEAAVKKLARKERKELEQKCIQFNCAERDKYKTKTGKEKRYRKGARAMMYLGYGLSAAAVIAAVFVGGTIWKQSEESPEKTPVSLSKTEQVLPIEETQRLIISTEEQELLVFDCYGQLIDCIESAEFYPQKGKEYYWNAWVISEEMPLPVACSGKDAVKGGIYSLVKAEWIIEPGEYSVNLLSENVWTTSEKSEDGQLMNMENKATTTIEDVFDRSGDFIISASSIHNLNGKKLCQWSPLHLMIDHWDDKLLRYNQEQGYYYLMDTEGVLWEADRDMRFDSRCGNLLNWTDAYGNGMITDTNLNLIMDETEFEEINSNIYMDGKELKVIGERADKRLKLVKKGLYYFVCDEEFRVHEHYPVQNVWLDTMNQKADEYADEILYQNWEGSAEEGVNWAWSWCLDNEERLLVMELLKMENYSIDTEGRLPATIQVKKEGSVVLFCCNYSKKEKEYYLSTDGSSTEQLEEGFEYDLTTLPGGVVCVKKSGEAEKEWYFTEDGEKLSVDETRQILAVTPNLQCVKDENGIYIGDYSGEFYQLINIK